MKVSKNCFRT